MQARGQVFFVVGMILALIMAALFFTLAGSYYGLFMGRQQPIPWWVWLFFALGAFFVIVAIVMLVLFIFSLNAVRQRLPLSARRYSEGLATFGSPRDVYSL